MKLSIISINKDNCQGLQRTIDSVLSQTWHGFEWIVIDGDSTDGSKELLELYDNKIDFWCSEPDKGIYNAMNKGVAHANGDYLLFLNSGDSLADKDVVGMLCTQEWKSDVISGQVIRMDNGRPLRTYDEDVLMQLYTDTLNHQGSLIRRDLLVKRPYDEGLRIVSDWKFGLETILYDNATVEYTDIVVAVQDVTGISFTETESKNRERQECLNIILPPPLHKTLENYKRMRIDYRQLRKTPEVRRLTFMKQRTPWLFKMVHWELAVIDRILKLFLPN